MAATYMLRKHLRSQELKNRPEAIAERAAHIEACKCAAAEREAKFPAITAENFEAANNYQKERIEHWMRELSS
ncbi:hypothetical protein [Epibacterium sp. Ofav1-8]|uniref:hypothetical protein n=1 Tax=Epibacterium sp. Ofav1-8 TaxID=2917735 RepID=UPI001EF57B60|nr:hypothetical protein [Epibacterium sp. Ofav1-8]MCG7625574.1 hypothetical protein [Epibacterium sp. Ofav1-8]